MAPIQKRRRENLDDDDDEVVLGSASSRMRNGEGQRKKAKLSDVNSGRREQDDGAKNDDDESSSDSDMEDTPPPSHNLPPSTQYEIERDAGFAYLENTDEDDLQAALAIESRKRSRDTNRPAESGILEKITCVNFMCHERLEVKFGPLVNFVVGENGSGKSALVAALQICLGVKASSTSRGTSLKGMIKNDRDAGLVQVQLANRGSDAYLPDQYGDSIVVERGFNRSGTSNFKLKSKTGRVMSTKKHDVEDLVEHFAIQVDNPMNILTQEKAKQFITSSGPAEKYKFFLRGTQLEQLDTDYKLMFETCDNLDIKVFEQKQNVEILTQRRKEARKKVDLVEQHHELKEKGQLYVRQCAWAQVEEQERILVKREQDVEQARIAVQEAEAKAATRGEEYEATHNLVAHADDAIEKLEDEISPLKEAESEAQSNCQAALDVLRKLKIDQRTIREELKSSKTSCGKLGAQIKAEEERLEELNGGSHARKIAEIEEARKKVEPCATAHEQAKLDLPRLQEQFNEAEEVDRRLRNSFGLKKGEIANAQVRRQALNSDRANASSGYHHNLSRLLSRIQNDRSFASEPIGPIGLQCKLLKPVWSDVLEAYLGSSLNAFVVSNSSDQRRLTNLAKAVGFHTSVWVVKESFFPLNEPDAQFDTILRVLDIENPLVRKALIINRSIEQILLIENEREARHILYDGAPPANVRECLSIDPKKRGWGIKQSAGANDSYGPIRGQANRAPRMKTDIATQITKQQSIVDDLRQELQELDGRLGEAKQNKERSSLAVRRQEMEIRDTKRKVQSARELVDKLEEELKEAEVPDGHLEGLRRALKDVEEEVQLHEGSFQDMQITIDSKNDEFTKLKGLHDDAKAIVAAQDFKIKAEYKKQKRLQNNRELCLQQKNDAFAMIDRLKAAEQSVIRKCEEQNKHVDNFLNSANEICQRVPVPPDETKGSLETKYARLSQQLKEYERRQGGSDDKVRIAYQQVHQSWKEATKVLTISDRLLKTIKITLADRMDKWRKFQKHISAHARMDFCSLLSERSFRGSLEFDHKSKLLGVQIEPDATRESDKGRQAKTLSGGEKSFSSICLLLSLWEAMGAPLRILDEYDVFMDDVNRDVSTRMIISAAQCSQGKQFVLITPNAINKKVQDEFLDVTFITMIAPRDRGQLSIEETMNVA